MEFTLKGKLEKVNHRHAPEVSKQTGFPSPATHYLEPSINLHQELINHSDATFFVRVQGDTHTAFDIYDQDVLIVDRAIHTKGGELALVVQDGEFKIVRISEKSLKIETTLWGVITYIIHKTL